jgi:hypothetical protein
LITAPPTEAGFLSFIRTVMGISTSVLPDNSPVIPMAYQVALAIVISPMGLCCYCPNPTIPANASGLSLMYTLAVYNLGGDNLLNYAQDLPDAPIYMDERPYFAYWRWKWNLYDFISGVVQSSSDVSTSQSLVVQKAAEEFTLMDLQNLKTPWGRRYLAIVQNFGAIWGIT